MKSDEKVNANLDNWGCARQPEPIEEQIAEVVGGLSEEECLRLAKLAKRRIDKALSASAWCDQMDARTRRIRQENIRLQASIDQLESAIRDTK